LRVAELRPVYLPPDPASRTAYAAGETAQCDLCFPPIELAVGFGQTRKPAPVLFAGWWQLIAALAAVPRGLVWDGEGAIGRWRAGRAELTSECQAFRRVLAAKAIVCRPHGFASPTDFNAQLADWLAMVNTRPRQALGVCPGGRCAVRLRPIALRS